MSSGFQFAGTRASGRSGYFESKNQLQTSGSTSEMVTISVGNVKDIAFDKSLNPTFGMSVALAPIATSSSVSTWTVEAIELLRQLRKDVSILLANKQTEQPRSMITSINTLAPAPLKVTKPIPVTMQVTDEDTVATFFDANISASGDTPQEAFSNLCDILIAKYNTFDSLDPKKLGKVPTRQLVVLREFISRA